MQSLDSSWPEQLKLKLQNQILLEREVVEVIIMVEAKDVLLETGDLTEEILQGITPKAAHYPTL